eukprot:tig00000042_g15627.t1
MSGHAYEDVSLLRLPDELILLVMEKAAAVSGTMAVLRGLASSRRRFQQLAKFGHRIERLCLGLVSFDPSGDRDVDGSSDSGNSGSESDSSGSSSSSDSLQLQEVLRACPNLTHLSLSDAYSYDETESGAFRHLAALEELPAGFSLPRLRHLDLSGLTVPLPALRRLLGACAASLERLFLRGTMLLSSDVEPIPFVSLVLALEGLDFPRLESLDVTRTDCAPSQLRSLLARLPALRDLYLMLFPRMNPDDARGYWESLADEVRRPGRLLVNESLLKMDAESLGKLRGHFDGTAYPRPEGSRLDVPRLVVPAFFKALGYGWRGVPPFFRDAAAVLARQGAPCAEGATALHALASGVLTTAEVRQLIAEWGLESFVNVPLRSGSRRTPLHLAVAHAPSVVGTLLELGADPFRRDAEGATALHVACAELIAEWGLESFVNVPLRSGSRRTPLHLAAAHAPGLVQVLLDIGANPILQDAAGATALHTACESGCVETVEALLDAAARKGLDLLSVRDEAGRSPLQLLLLGRGDSRARSRIATHFVEFQGLDESQLETYGVRRAFLEEPVWGEGGTEFLLHFAARECTPAAVRALLEAGADPCLKDRDGWTVLDFAQLWRKAALKEAIVSFASKKGVFDKLCRGDLDSAAGSASRPEKRARAAP